MTDSELQAEYDRLNDQRKAINDQIREIRAELRVRSEADRIGSKSNH